MKTTIIGSDIQAAEVELNTGEFVQAESGSMFYMEGNIEMDARVPGGWVGGLKRMVVGETFVLPVFKAKSDNCKVSFSPNYPGKIIEVDISENKSWTAQKSGFLFASGNVGINISFVKKFKAGFFGGEGFILQKFTGNGKVYLHSGGLAVEKELAPNETINIDTGCIVAFEESVTYDVKSQKNIATALFGGEGIFLSTLTGPGKVILQSLPWSRLSKLIVTGKNSNGAFSDIGKIFGGD